MHASFLLREERVGIEKASRATQSLKRSVLGGAHKCARKSAQIANRLCLGVDVHREQLSLASAVSQARHASIRAGFDSGVVPGHVRPGGRSSASRYMCCNASRLTRGQLPVTISSGKSPW